MQRFEVRSVVGRRGAAALATAALAALVSLLWIPALGSAAVVPRSDAMVASFERLGQLGGPSRTAAPLGSHLLLALGSRVEVLDLATASSPRWVGAALVPGVVGALAASRDTAYAMEESGRLHVVDVTDPSAPAVLASLAPPGAWHGWPRRAAVRGGVLYAAGAAGVAVADVADPMHPRWIGIDASASAATDLVATQDALYVATIRAEDPSRTAELRVYDRSDPASPVLAGVAAVAPELGDRLGDEVSLAVAGTSAYVSVYAYLDIDDVDGGGTAAPQAGIPTESHVVAFDVADPGRPLQTGRLDVSPAVEFPGRLAVIGDRLFLEASMYGGPGVTYGKMGLLVEIDIGEPGRPAFVRQLDWHPDAGSDAIADGARLYVTEDHGGLRVLDATGPQTPTLLAHVDAPFVPRAVDGEDGRLLLGDHGTGGVWAVDATYPAWPALGGHDVLGRGACGSTCEIELRDGIAYMADFNEGLIVMDLDDGPKELARLGDIRSVEGLALGPAHAFLASQPAGVTSPSELVVVSVADPAAPVEVGRCPLPPYVTDLAYANGHVYAVTAGGLTVVRVTDPADPQVVATTGLGTFGWSVDAVQDHLYLAEVNGAFHVLDVADPARPMEIGYLPKAHEDDVRPNAAHEMHAVGDVAYVMHLRWLQAIDVRDPRRPKELGWIAAADLGATNGFIDLAVERPNPQAEGPAPADSDLLYAVGQDNGLFVVAAHRRYGPRRPVYVPFAEG